MADLGYFAVALLMFAENIFPPIPSEVIMPLAGYLVFEGKLTFAGVLIAGSIGSLIGTWIWYAVAARIGKDRVYHLVEKHGRWLTLSTADLDRAEGWFERHGKGAVLLGRMVPGVRTLISVPAGLTDMPLHIFFIYSLIGTAVWTALLTGAGFLLGSQFDRVAAWLNPVTNLLLGGLLVIYVYRLIRGKGK